MKHQIAKFANATRCATFLFRSVLPLSVLPMTCDAQSALTADRQILPETEHAAWTIKKGPHDSLYVLSQARMSPSSLWVWDHSGSSTHVLVGGAPQSADLRLPKDLAVDRDGNAIVIDAGMIKIFSDEGKLLSSFAADRPQSVSVLRDGRILVSGLPRDALVSVFDRNGKLLGQIGEPVSLKDAADPGFNAVFNSGSIVVDDDDNIFYIFRFLLTPTIRKYAPEGRLLAEWHPENSYLDQVIERAQKTYEANKLSGNHGGNPVLNAGAFDSDTKTLWVASGSQVMQLDSSGKIIRSFELFLPRGEPPLQAQGLVVDGDFIRASTPLHGTFEFSKPR